ncbi:hypothetical protein J2S17_000533 [Cytobacillus purgationiresistens]|uniref:Uncharacterized protein n=1 Tax=Cytobacillus purgationiresistens TaxID=863449 RepID=A0ABU0ABP2_9BACI|nr:hypothetical protein [Cytobacillus purgationiresistens]
MEKFKQNSMPKLIEDEILKRNPNKDPKDIKIEGAQKEIN